MSDAASPNKALNVSVRPLDKGMVRDASSQLIPDGGVLEAVNLFAERRGLKRRQGFTNYAAGETLPYVPVDIVTVWTSEGAQYAMALTEKTLFKLSPRTGYEEVEWAYSTGTISVSGTTVTGSGTAFTSNDILNGDVLRVGSNEAVVSSVTSDTELVLVAADIPDGSYASYSIQRTSSGKVQGTSLDSFTPTLDYAVAEDCVAVADGKRPLLRYDPDSDTLEKWTTSLSNLPACGEFVPACVAYFGDRIWVGHTHDGTDGDKRQRIRWSALADSSDFSIETNYLDLPYTDGACRRLVPLDDRLVAYFDDCIFIGTPTNYPLLPYRFDKAETGSIGVVGTKALSTTLGGHYFCGQDNAYYWKVGEVVPVPIGNRTIQDAIAACQRLDRVYVVKDPVNDQVLFSIPSSGIYADKVYCFNLKTQGWSYMDVQPSMVAASYINVPTTWNSLTGTWDDLGTATPTWDSFQTSDARPTVYIENNYAVWKMSTSVVDDYATTPIRAYIESKDHDFDLPDENKAFVRLGVKLDFDVAPSVPVTFAVSISTNRGRNWRSVGTLSITVGDDEGWINFKAFGSHLRFKLTSYSLSTPYWISEYGLRVRLAGAELATGNQ